VSLAGERRYQSSVTFSGSLNALDGVASGEEQIIFLTTKHPDRLDPALIRPGRVDLAALIDDAVPEQARMLFTNFYGNDGQPEDDAASEEVERGVGRRISMAALQGTFIRYDTKMPWHQRENFQPNDNRTKNVGSFLRVGRVQYNTAQ